MKKPSRNGYRAAALLALVFAASQTPAILSNVAVTPNQVVVEKKIDIATNDVAHMKKTLFAMIRRDTFIASMKPAFSEAKKVSFADGAKTLEEMHYFFVKTTIHRIPMALVSFKTKSISCQNNAPKTCKNTITIELAKPFNLYPSYFDFTMQNLNNVALDDIQLSIKSEFDGTVWTLRSTMSFKNLFVFNWLDSLATRMNLGKTPTMHKSLLFFKNRFAALHTNVASAL